MHFEVLVEDLSGKKSLDLLLPKIIGQANSFRVHAYKGIGRIPKNMRDARDASRRILLENLPRLLRGYGNAQVGRRGFAEFVIVVCDLDDRCLNAFRKELHGVLNSCKPKPRAGFCLAVEEGEAWLLGDLRAIRAAYPKAKNAVLNSYVNDSICGTWEVLADALYTGGSSALTEQGWQAIGVEKSKWAEGIAPLMDVNENASPSFCYFRDKLQRLAGTN